VSFCPHIDRRRLQRLVADQLPHTGIDVIETTENLHRTLHARRFPARDGLKFSQYLVEALLQIGQHLIGIRRHAVSGIDGRGRTAYQDGLRQDALQAGGGGQNLLPVRQGVGRHSFSKSDSAGHRGRARAHRRLGAPSP